MKASEDYFRQCAGVIAAVAAQKAEIDRAADWFAETILGGRMVHLFGSGHSRIMVEEMWPRYGSFPGWNPIVELSLTFHNLATGANGQRQAMYLENVSGFAARILRNFDITTEDAALIVSSSGTSVVPTAVCGTWTSMVRGGVALGFDGLEPAHVTLPSSIFTVW